MLLSATFESLRVSDLFGRTLTQRVIIKILDDFLEQSREFFLFVRLGSMVHLGQMDLILTFLEFRQVMEQILHLISQVELH